MYITFLYFCYLTLLPPSADKVFFGFWCVVCPPGATPWYSTMPSEVAIYLGIDRAFCGLWMSRIQTHDCYVAARCATYLWATTLICVWGGGVRELLPGVRAGEGGLEVWVNLNAFKLLNLTLSHGVLRRWVASYISGFSTALTADQKITLL